MRNAGSTASKMTTLCPIVREFKVEAAQNAVALLRNINTPQSSTTWREERQSSTRFYQGKFLRWTFKERTKS